MLWSHNSVVILSVRTNCHTLDNRRLEMHQLAEYTACNRREIIVFFLSFLPLHNQVLDVEETNKRKLEYSIFASCFN